MPRWSREPDADQRTELAITGFKNGLYKAGKMLQSLTVLTQIHCAGDSTANINLTKSCILNSSDYYPCRLCSCATVYIPWKMLRDTFC